MGELSRCAYNHFILNSLVELQDYRILTCFGCHTLLTILSGFYHVPLMFLLSQRLAYFRCRT